MTASVNFIGVIISVLISTQCFVLTNKVCIQFKEVAQTGTKYYPYHLSGTGFWIFVPSCCVKSVLSHQFRFARRALCKVTLYIIIIK